MAATGGRNQRRLANLKTESTCAVVEGDTELSLLSQSIVEQTKIRANLQWTSERERLTALVEMGRQMSDIPDAEKSANMRELYNFLKRPIEEVKPDKPTGDQKRIKLFDDKLTHDVVTLSYSTPASSLATSSSSTITQVEPECDFLLPRNIDPNRKESETRWEYDEDEYDDEYYVAI